MARSPSRRQSTTGGCAPKKTASSARPSSAPPRDWQCYCGKYKQIRYKGITCEKCGVLVTRSSVRRERMGHIELAAPVAHIWYTRRVPSYLGLLLDISRRNLDRVLYFAQYVITRLDEQARAKALKRLDDELSRERTGMERSQQEQIDATARARRRQIEQLRETEQATQRRLDEQQTQAIEAVMKDAQSIQRKLEDQMGKPARASVIFPNDRKSRLLARGRDGHQRASEHAERNGRSAAEPDQDRRGRRTGARARPD